MLLGLISDSHGHTLNTLDGLRLLETMKVDCICHCGDIGSPAIPRLFPVPSYFVLGNVDRDEEELRTAIEAAGHTCCGRFGDLELDGLRIALIHGDDTTRLQATWQSGDYDVICTGHTHQRNCERRGSTRIINPGAVYRARPHSVAVVTLPELEVQFLEF